MQKKPHPNILDYSVGPRLKVLPNLPHRKLEKYAKEMPDAVAVFYQDQEITYSKLNSKANKLAQLLISLNVQRNSIVGIYLRRCPELVLATIAIHKANAACSLLDPNLPLIRLNEIIGELKPRVMVTSKPHAQYFIEHNIKVIDAESMDSLIEAYPDEMLPDNPEPDDVAHIFFTSGSTGKPKAVITTYGWQADTSYSPPYSERHMLKIDSGTTFTRAEVLRPLLSGQSLYITPQGIEKNLYELIAYIQRHQITHLISTPSALAAMLEIDDFRNCRSINTILCSGELVPAKLRHDLNTIMDVTLIISYGTTEAPGAVRFTFDPQEDSALLTVGKTAPLMEAYVLDENLSPLPVGVEGEVHLGGIIAKGYMNDPELTLQKFIPHPFNAGHGHLFKTGDIGKWLSGGYLQILRRMDSQIKIRGYRIEMGEIEKVLLQDPGISQAAVMASTKPNGETSIVAYVVPRFGGLKSADIRIAIKQVLPDYMIPDRFIINSSMALTANGKIDRAALRFAIDEAVESLRQIKPQDVIEKSLVSIWESLLNVSPIGTNENFFDLGGNSLLAAQMQIQVEKLFQKKLPLDLLWFNEGTILSLANILRNEFHAAFNAELITLKQGNTRPLFVAHVRGGHLQDYYQLSRCLAPGQTVIGLQARGILGLGKPDMSMEKIAHHCIESMQSVQPKGPYLLAGFSSGGILAYEIAQQLKKRGERLALLVLLDTYCQNNNNFIRLSAVTRQLFKGRTRAFRDYLYSFIISGLMLDRVGIYNDAKKAHRWAHMSYFIKKTAQKTLLFLAEDSVTKTGKKMLGWDHYLVGDVTQYHFPCNHTDLVRYPFVTEVAEKLQPHLDQANLEN